MTSEKTYRERALVLADRLSALEEAARDSVAARDVGMYARSQARRNLAAAALSFAAAARTLAGRT